MNTPQLIVLGGLPGTGKSTIARALLARLPAAYLRIDTLEQALAALHPGEEVGAAGYLLAYELARSNLALGMPVLADCVNPVAATRQAWRAVAAQYSAACLEVQIVCSDLAEHRRRVEQRQLDAPGAALPSWHDVVHREFEAWASPHLVIDSALLSASEAAGIIARRAAG